MASPLPANYLALARENHNERVTLVKIELTDPSALTLRFGEAETNTPDGETWEGGLIEPGAIHTECAMLQTRLASVSYSCELADIEPQDSSDRLSDLFASYVWNGATITVYEWLPRLTSFSDAAQLFTGQITFCRMEGHRLILDAERTFTFNVRLPQEEITRAKFPRAPEKNIGRPIPFIIGSHRTPPALSPAAAYGAFQWGIVSGRGARGGLRGVVASNGRGESGEKGKVLFASHALHTLQDESIGCSPFLEAGGKLCDLNSSDTFNTNTEGAGIRIADVTSGGTYPFDVFYAVVPLEVQLAASNNAQNVRAVLDPLNLRSYCRLNYDNGERNLTLKPSQAAARGTIVDIRLVACFSNSHTLGTSPGPFIKLNGVGGGGGLGTVASATPTADSLSLNPINWPTVNWDFSQCTITAGFDGVATGRWINLYYAAIVVGFRPDLPIIEPGSQRTVWVHRDPIVIRGKEIAPARDLPRVEQIPPTREYTDNEFFIACEGIEDDGRNYTAGGVGTLIESPPDALRWVLEDRLGFSGSDIELGATDFGSLIYARDWMKTWRRSEMKAALGVTEFVSAEQVIEDLCQAGLMLPVVNRFDGKWNVVPWRADKEVDYDWTFGFDDMLNGEAPAVELIPTDVENDFELEYWIDDWSRVGMKCFLGPARSNAGHLYGQIRDEDLTVVASVNDRIDFTDSGARVATLTAGAYTGGSLAAHAQTQMRAAAGGSRVPFISYGFTVTAGSNDKIDMVENAVALVATLNPGTYTGAALATEVARAMNAASLNASTYSCTYSDTTRKFTINQAGAIGISNTFTFAAVAPSFLTCAAVLLGFSFASNNYPDTSDNEVEAESFYFACSGGSLVLNWETGANGINAATPRCAAYLFGHDPQRDLTATTWLAPHSPKSHREQTLATSRQRFGSPEPKSRRFRAVNDTDTIRQLRNELAALLSTPPVRVFFPTTRAPDLELGRIIGFDSTLDDYRGCPTFDGSGSGWAGKRFVVLGITHYLGGPNTLKHQQIHAASLP